MSNLGDNSCSPTPPTSTSHQSPIQQTPIPTSDENTTLSLSVTNHGAKVDDSGYNSSKLKSEKKLGGASKNGTSHLREHSDRCSKRFQMDIRQQVLVANQRKVDGKVTLKNLSFDQNVTRRELANMIIMHEYPLSMVDHVQFRKYSYSLQPLFAMPSRNTIKSDILKIFKEEKAKIISKLEANEGRIAITTDMWTADHQKRGYMAVTAHYIDNQWNLQKCIIRFEYVPTLHTKEVITSSLMKCFLDWNIDRKLSSITVDNCSVNDGVIELLIDRIGCDAFLLNGAFFHMRCCAHILHLIMKDGLSVIGDGIEIIRDSVLFWGATPKSWEKFEEAARQLRIPTLKRLCVDVKTRWNSTYLMLRTALFYKDVFPRCVQLHGDPLYKHLPTENDWIIATEICEKLKLFYDITEGFSGTKYATANIYFPNICKIRLALNEWIMHTDRIISCMAVSMLGKFEKYWNDVLGIMGVATILDPRIVQICRDLVKEYEKNLALKKEEGPSSSSFSFLDGVEVIPRKGDFDILNWWKLTGPQFLTLQLIVRDIYAIPVFTVASKSTFSTGGRLVSAQRNRLHPSTIEALTCCQSWLWAKEEGSISLEENSFYEDVDDSEIEEKITSVTKEWTQLHQHAEEWTQKFTQVEIEEKKRKWLCYWCGTKYTPEHKCMKSQTYQLIISDCE
ncbi:zinc finger BED domain-containing protein RICESLEEPER 1-like [Durio zibethinus]|uniref:Zinc finger BED domain-containing protein RICESLEEPER 1-like n=1 Tax=Durio zibethinus TaxID=66656 RepID=A0A6P5WEV3_DURZI|nr:zinc finger BED domain-containing protein RICESLEEPER 1-like [Durio zibethinus]